MKLLNVLHCTLYINLLSSFLIYSLYGVTFVFKFKFLLQKMILLFIILL
jgi:hypothetical protein